MLLVPVNRYISRPSKQLDNPLLLYFYFAGEEEVRERGGPSKAARLPEGRGFPKCWRHGRLGPVAAFLHDIINTARLTGLPVPYGCSRKSPQTGKSSCPSHWTQPSSMNCNYLSADSLLKEEA